MSTAARVGSPAPAGSEEVAQGLPYDGLMDAHDGQVAHVAQSDDGIETNDRNDGPEEGACTMRSPAPWKREPAAMRKRWEDRMGREAFVDESCIREAIRLVFEEDLEVTGTPLVLPAENLGGNMVSFHTVRGDVTLLDETGQLLFGRFDGVRPSERAPSVPLEVAATNAQRVIDRIFPWARAMPWTGKLNDHGSAGVDYDISWREVVDGVELPSWATSTTTSRGEVMTFNGHYYPITSPPRIVWSIRTPHSPSHWPRCRRSQG